MVDLEILAVPSDEEVDALSATFAPEEILEAARATVDHYRPSIESVMESLAPVNDSMVQAEGVVGAQMWKLVVVDGVLWIPAACALGCVVAALYHSMVQKISSIDDDNHGEGTPMRDEGKHAEEDRKRAALRCLHVSFYGGLAFTALIAAPVFAFLSIAALPLSDVCLIVPATNGSASALLRLLEIDGELSSAANLVQLPLAPTHPRNRTPFSHILTSQQTVAAVSSGQWLQLRTLGIHWQPLATAANVVATVVGVVGTEVTEMFEGGGGDARAHRWSSVNPGYALRGHMHERAHMEDELLKQSWRERGREGSRVERRLLSASMRAERGWGVGGDDDGGGGIVPGDDNDDDGSGSLPRCVGAAVCECPDV